MLNLNLDAWAFILGPPLEIMNCLFIKVYMYGWLACLLHMYSQYGSVTDLRETSVLCLKDNIGIISFAHDGPLSLL